MAVAVVRGGDCELRVRECRVRGEAGPGWPVDPAALRLYAGLALWPPSARPCACAMYMPFRAPRALPRALGLAPGGGVAALAAADRAITV